MCKVFITKLRKRNIFQIKKCKSKKQQKRKEMINKSIATVETDIEIESTTALLQLKKI